MIFKLNKPLLAIFCFLFINSYATENKKIIETYGKIPMNFELNKGQVDEKVDYIARGEGYDLFLLSNKAILSLNSHVLEINVLNSNPFSTVSGIKRQSGISNYFIGNDPTKWHTDIPHYEKVKYKEVYPGIDIVYYGNQQQLEYDFILSSGANPENILLGFTGAQNITIDDKGNLLLQLSETNQVIQKVPFMYQTVNNKRVKIEGQYVLKGDHKVGFEVGNYDLESSLIIDPVVFYSTLLGGSGIESSQRIVVDNNGNAYVTGQTNSTDFPVTAGAFNSTKSGSNTGSDANDIFISKLSADASHLVYSTYLGGSKREIASRIAIDSIGNAYISSFTLSTDFPTTSGVIGETPFGLGGSSLDDIAITKLSPDGGSLIYSTYMGSSGDDQPFAIAVDNLGNVCVAGNTNDPLYPTTIGAYSTSKSSFFDGVVSKLNTDASALLYSTFLGGNGSVDGPLDVVLNTSNDIYITGITNSTDFPVTTGAFQPLNNGLFDNFLSIISPIGNGVNDLLYSTYIGGSVNDEGCGIAIDNIGDVYITGFTASTDYPTTLSSFQSTFGGGVTDGFLTKINPNGNGVNDLIYSTYIGGNNTDELESIVLDASNNPFMVGFTASSDFPVMNAIQTSLSGVRDAVVIQLNLSNNGTDDLLFSTFYGGSNVEDGRDIAIDATESIYVLGTTQSISSFPVTPGSQQSNHAVGSDAFVVKISNGSSMFFDGFIQTPLGQSQITEQGKDLLVSNIGPMGNDGILVTSGNVSFHVDVSLKKNAPIGTKVTMTSLGTLSNGIPNQILENLTVEKLSDGQLVTPDFSPMGATTYTLNLYKVDGSLVYSESGKSGPAGLANGGGKLRKCRHKRAHPGGGLFDWWNKITYHWADFSGGGDFFGIFSVTNGPTIEADYITLEPDAPLTSIASVCASEIITAVGVSEFTIPGEWAVAFNEKNIPHTTLGDARFSGTDMDTVRVSNIGSSGNDGVEIDFIDFIVGDMVTSFEMEMLEIDSLDILPQTAMLMIGVTGSVEGRAGSDIGIIEIEKVGNKLEFLPNFTAVNSTTTTIEIFNNGSFVNRVTGHTGIAAMVSSDKWPIGLGSIDSGANVFTKWTSSLNITIPGFGTYFGNELRMTAESEEVNFLESFSIRARDIPIFTLIDGTVGRDTTIIENECGHDNNKVLVCHKDKTICIDRHALSAHIAHGDVEGECITLNLNSLMESVKKGLQVIISPNPASENTTIAYSVDKTSNITISIFNNFGKEEILIVENKPQIEGQYKINVITDKLSNGVYFVVLKTGDDIATKRFIIAK